MKRLFFIASLLLLVFSCQKKISAEEIKERAEYRKKQILQEEETEKRTAKALQFLYKLEQSDSILYEDIYYIIGEEAIESYRLGDRD